MNKSRSVNVKTINGKIYVSARDAYNRLSPKMSYSTFTGRYNQDLPYEQLMAPSAFIKKRETLVINNVQYRSVRDAYVALKPKIAIGTFYKRIQAGERDIANLLNFMPKTKELTVDGFVYDSVYEAYADIQPPTSLEIFRRRIYDGYSIEQLMEPKHNNLRKLEKTKL